MPIVVVNAALLFCLGPGPGLHFTRTLSGVAASPDTGAGNHSAASFSQMVDGFLGARGLPAIPSAVFLGLPVVIWGVSVLILLRRGYSESGAIWLFAASVPLMNLIPSTSHDYKLFLLSAPFAMLLTILLGDTVSSGRRFPLAQIAVVCALLCLLSVSYVVLPSVLANKYPFVLGAQLLIVWALMTTPSTLGRALTMDSGAERTPTAA